MGYFSSREITAISLSAALWAVFNWLVSPLFWEVTHLPILCDMVGVTALTFSLWWTQKAGAGTAMGLIATALNFFLRPGALHFLGFTVACIFFDVVSSAIGHGKFLGKSLASHASIVALSVVSTALAGYIIGNFFMNPGYLASSFGGVLVFSAVHGAGGLIGGVLGVVIIRGLESRMVVPGVGFNQ